MANNTHTIYEQERAYRPWVIVFCGLSLMCQAFFVRFVQRASAETLAFVALGLVLDATIVGFLSQRNASVGFVPLLCVATGSFATASLFSNPNSFTHILAIVFALLGLIALIFLLKHFWLMSRACALLGSELSNDASLVILGCAAHKGIPSPTLEERLKKAFAAWTESPKRLLVVTGGPLVHESSSEAAVMRDWLLAHGVDAKSIVVEDGALNTEQNIKNAFELIASRRPNSQIALVTSGYHMYRARKIASERNVDTYPLACKTPLLGRLVQWSREALVIAFGSRV